MRPRRAIRRAIAVSAFLAGPGWSALSSTGCVGADPDSAAPPAEGGTDAGAGGNGGGSETGNGSGSPDAGAPETAPPPKTYLSCGDAHGQNIHADGDYPIDLDGPSGPLPTFTAHCVNMSSTSQEVDDYLSLVHTTDPKASGAPTGSNVSVWGNGSNGTTCSGDVIRAYQRVRLLYFDPTATPPPPSRIAILVTDAAYSTTNVDSSACSPSDGAPFSAPAFDLGVASACDRVVSANVDLGGTPFRIISGETGTDSGGGTTGTTSYSTDRKTATMTTGGGGCDNRFADDQRAAPLANMLFIDFDPK